MGRLIITECLNKKTAKFFAPKNGGWPGQEAIPGKYWVERHTGEERKLVIARDENGDWWQVFDDGVQRRSHSPAGFQKTFEDGHYVETVCFKRRIG